MDKRGLTLMEVIIAALILSVTVGGILYIFSTEKGVVARTGRRVQAMDFARQTLEELKNAVDATTWPGGDLAETDADWDGGDADWVFGGTLSGDFGPGGKFEGQGRRYRVQNIGTITTDPRYKKVEVVVDWSEPAGPQ